MPYQLDHEISAVLIIDAPEGLCECPATFGITADWERGECVHAFAAHLLTWTFNGREHDAKLAEAVLGHEELARQAALVRERWLETADENRAIDLVGDRIDASKVAA